ncbi:MAG: hypothetical protein EOP39_17810 [Rubrivivax sp.]|nr:MAG: hypothetical protein EOP39_17810 [Rubrivivax sp.]
MTDVGLISGNSGAGKSRRLWLLVAITSAILLWLGADELKSRQPMLRQQVDQAIKRIERSSPGALEARKAEARQLADERRAILDRLKSDENEQMTRARLVYELRQKCDAVPVVCRVRLADLSVGLASARAPAGAASAGGSDVEALGVGRARAVLSGTFKDEELMSLYRSFGEDTRYQWRLNATVVRNNNFELDVERLVLYSNSSAEERAP